MALEESIVGRHLLRGFHGRAGVATSYVRVVAQTRLRIIVNGETRFDLHSLLVRYEKFRLTAPYMQRGARAACRLFSAVGYESNRNIAHYVVSG